MKAGFKVEGATLVQGAPITPDSYKQFTNTMEVKAFFSQYVKERGAPAGAGDPPVREERSC